MQCICLARFLAAWANPNTMAREMRVGNSPIIAMLLSLVIPGVGQMAAGRKHKGAAILAAAIVIGNLNLLCLLLFSSAAIGPEAAWAYWILRIGHDVMALWSLAFWIWAVIDAYQCAAANRRRDG